jgi:hypothetical protein
MFYYAEDDYKKVNGVDQFVDRTPSDSPRKSEGITRISILGDSMGESDPNWGWSPIIANVIAK